ncbi:MAG: HlyD family efflux transporter periplasmic adaptor subunit, partial [Pseudomonadota bacterium]
MRVLSILSALLVVASLYLLVFERERLLSFSGANAAQPVEAETETASEATETEPEPEDGRVSVVALRSEARQIDGAVIVRGRTEAIRQVELRAETTGRIISEPLRRGSFVNEGDLLCSLAPGTRQNNLAEAKARLAEAQARAPEAEARVAEAKARLVEAEINDRAASRLSQEGFASETRVAQTAAAVEAALAGVESANSNLAAAVAGIQSAEAMVAAAVNELEKLEITAPFAGLLESDTAELGALLQPGSLCGTIIQLDTIKLVGFIPETLVDRVEIGSVAGARLSSGREVTGKVTFISRSAD